jgi:aerobic-type carbon monoxide dehydrogenase small subunit (CoxS/CutS family)
VCGAPVLAKFEEHSRQSGNLCRCGAYPQIVEAVNLAARKLRIG